MTLYFLLMISFPEAVLVSALGFLLVGIKPRWRELLVIGAIQTCFSYIIRISPVSFGLHSILEILLFILNLCVVTRLPYRLVLLISLLGLIFYGSIETAVIPLMLRITGYTLSEVIKHPYLRIFFFFAQAFVMLICITICLIFRVSLIKYGTADGYTVPLQRKLFQKNRQINTINKQNLSIYVVVLLPLLLLVILNSAFNASRLNVFPERNTDIFISLIGLSIIVLAVLSVFAVRKIGQYVEKEYEVKRAGENLKHIEQLIVSSRKQRHDFHHQLQTVYGLLETGSYERARDHICKIFNAATQTRELINTDNLTISAILYTKIGQAEARNIDLEITINCSLKEFPLNITESGSLFGNIIDNAMEAMEDKTDKRRKVHLSISLEYGAYIIQCSNTSDTIEPRIQGQIFEAGFSTKKGHSGLGLSIAKDIVNKYGGNIEVQSDEKEITFTVTLPRKK